VGTPPLEGGASVGCGAIVAVGSGTAVAEDPQAANDVSNVMAISGKICRR